MGVVLMTVVETPGFLREAQRALSDEEVVSLIHFLAANPQAGDVMPETGGARKLRWRAPGRGKRGGVRVIYYYHDESIPLFLLNVFAKNEKSNLTKAERNEIGKLLPRLVGKLSKEGVVMKKARETTGLKASAGSRIISSLQEAVDWAEGKDIAVRVSRFEVPVVDVKALRKKLRLSQSAFAAKFGFQAATLRNWEQGRTQPDGPARVLLAVIARHPEAVEDAVRKAS